MLFILYDHVTVLYRTIQGTRGLVSRNANGSRSRVDWVYRLCILLTRCLLSRLQTETTDVGKLHTLPKSLLDVELPPS